MLRKHSGDAIEIVDSAAQRFAATVQVDGRKVRAQLQDAVSRPEAAALEITVAQSVPKGSKMDFVVEKLTELGVSAIVPLRSERTIASHANASKIERWRRLAKSAAAQSGRDWIPTIAEPREFTDLLHEFGAYDAVLFPWELAEPERLRETLPQALGDARRVLAIVGPEGGFSHAEAEAAHRAGARTISLGERILRTETAALVLVSLLNYLAGV